MGWVLIGLGVVVLAVAILWIRRPLRPGARFLWFATAQAAAIGLALVSAGVAVMTTGTLRSVAWVLVGAFLVGNVLAILGGIRAARRSLR